MAVLQSEDKECASAFKLTAADQVQLRDQTWQKFRLNLTAGDHQISLGNPGNPGNPGDMDSTAESEACLLCRRPDDEIAGLLYQLEALVHRRKDRVLFEPAEPSFSLEISRCHGDGLKVHVWLDSGNAKSGIYRWDAFGIRFFTLDQHLASFVEQLRQEFAC
jgi:hypothetical protein